MRAERRVLGVDAGGTGSRAVVVVDGQVVERVEMGPLNVLLHQDSLPRLAGLISDTRADAAGLGLAGIQSIDDAKAVVTGLRALINVPVAVTDDSEAALFGAFDGRPGIVVIAGTGSIGCGRDASGRVLRIGGHGFLLGDEGGGYWIGRQCVRAALRAHDGTGPATPLVDLVAQIFGDDPREVVRRVHESPTDRELLTALVPQAAALTDDVTREIFRHAADQLVELAVTLRAQLGPLPCAMVGGVFHIEAIRAAFTTATDAVLPLGPPEMGAVRYAEYVLAKEMAWS